MASCHELRFRIEAYTPDTMPMARLAEYLTELAKVLGERKNVHFASVEPGSTAVVTKVEHEALPKVRERVVAVRSGHGPAEARRAYKSINKMLRSDNGVGTLHEGGAEILRFPGREDVGRIKGVTEPGTIDGRVERIGGTGDPVPLLLSTNELVVPGCWARRQVAKSIGPYLFEPIRLFGRGRWERDEDGVWTLDRFYVDNFQPLKDESLSSTLTAIRALGGEWGPNAIEELVELRDGGEKANGGGS